MAADHDRGAWDGGRGDVLLQSVGDRDQTAERQSASAECGRDGVHRVIAGSLVESSGMRRRGRSPPRQVCCISGWNAGITERWHG
jgi:hypothetical protein